MLPSPGVLRLARRRRRLRLSPALLRRPHGGLRRLLSVHGRRAAPRARAACSGGGAGWLASGGAPPVLGLAATVVMRRQPEDHGLLPDGGAARPVTAAAPVVEVSFGARQAARTPAFWLLIVSTNLAGLGFFGVNLHQFSFVTDRGL